MTLMLVTLEGLTQLSKSLTLRVKGELRNYYVGDNSTVPVVVVAKGELLQVGQIWDVSVGYETGIPKYCHQAHVGRKIGKITFQKLLMTDGVADDDQIIPLGLQISYFKKTYGEG